MSVPGIVHSTLDGDEIAARVSLGGDDELFITPSATLVYRSDGLLSDESVDEFPHEAERLTLSEGRRKTKLTLEYPLEGTKQFSIPGDKTDDVLHPVLAGVLNGNGITDPGETVVKTYRFSELTLIVTSDRLVKHIGAAVWDGDYEEYHFEDVTQLAFEDGSVATQIVLTVDGRPQRIKAPNEEANDLRERLKRALCSYHDVASLEELNRTLGTDEDDGRSRGAVDFGDGVDPLDANPPELDADETSESDATGDTTRTPGHGGDPLAAGEPTDSRPANANGDRTATDPSAGTEAEAEVAQSEREGERKQNIEQKQDLEQSSARSTHRSEADQQSAQSRSQPQSQSHTHSQSQSRQSATRDTQQTAQQGGSQSTAHNRRDGNSHSSATTETLDTEAGGDAASTAVDDVETALDETQAAAESTGATSKTPETTPEDDALDYGAAGAAPVTDESGALEPGSDEDVDREATPTDSELLERVESLEAAVDRQTELIEKQQATIEQLVSELRSNR
ncbi:DUF7115 domain-containing protein [Natronolimnohabitans innermongolicus]|uniref:DUF7115 domain-containing protein n=1 Tax=Natronolimnohabitans innermongolicus JCM 12255 TaxID=1227499 RepID=L9X7Q5_9EURY|nr:hypothetical protein [Natronolimnohabitans innermongolicus]ELY57627.1 hypothetical protein C493_09106 [Natronolimnohabitans innermongolicus JCM 12255]